MESSQKMMIRVNLKNVVETFTVMLVSKTLNFASFDSKPVVLHSTMLGLNFASNIGKCNLLLSI